MKCCLNPLIGVGRDAMFGALLLALLAVPTIASTDSSADSDPESLALMQAVSARADAGRQEAKLRFVLTPKTGSQQVRESVAYRSVDAQARKLAIAFTAPAAIRGSSFLAWDARETSVADDQWLYLPALRRTRRIPGRERGSYFLGTDLTYDDIRSFGRMEVAEFRLAPAQPVAGANDVMEIEGVPRDAEVAKDLGYSRIRWQVDTQRAFVLRSAHWDLQGAPLKNVRYEQLEKIGGVWAARVIVVENLKTGHRTELQFSEIVNDAQFDPARLTPAGLERGS